MSWGFTAALTLLLVELFLRLPLLTAVREAARTGRRAVRAMAAKKASDHWKEKAVQACAGRMAKAALVLAGGLALIAAAGTVLTLAAERLLPGTTAILLSWPGLVLSLAVATAYVMARPYLGGR